MPKMSLNRAGKPKNFKKAMGNFIGFIKPHAWGIVLAILFSLAAAIISLVGPNLLQEIANAILKPIQKGGEALEWFNNPENVSFFYDASY